MNKVRIAIQGSGIIARYHARACQAIPEVELVAAANWRPESLERLAREWNIPRTTTSFAELAADPEIDAVIVTVPNALHKDETIRMLRAGKHVLVEKPMATHLDAAREMVETAKRCQRHLLCAPFTQLSPTFQAIGRRLRRGDIGRVVSARGRYGWAGPDWADWFYKPEGGALFDLGVYNLTTLTGWLGPVLRVTAMAGVAVPERLVGDRAVRVEAEDNAQVLLDFGGARLGALTSSFSIQQYRGPGLELFGTEGTLYLLGDDWDPDGYEVWQNSAGCWQLFKETQPDWPWTDGLRHLVECIRGGVRPQVTPEHAFHVLEVMIEAQQSAREGRTRTIQSTFQPAAFAAESVETVAAHRVHDRTRAE
jgi:predicted dehydrogenase